MCFPRGAAIGALIALAVAGCGRKDEAAKAPAGTEAAATAPAAIAQPKRKPGLWEQTVSMGDFSQTSRLCLDAATEAEFSLWGAQAGKDMCAENSVTPQAGGWRFRSVCDMGSGGRTTTEGQASGDFSTAYKVEASTTTEGAAAPQMNGTRKMTMTATWKGACPAGMKPGDMELPGGVRMNLSEMARMRGVAGQ